MAVDTPQAPQICRKPTERRGSFDGCIERIRPIMMTTGQLCRARPRPEQTFAKSPNYDPLSDVSIIMKDLKSEGYEEPDQLEA
jgi:hypothetical protein